MEGIFYASVLLFVGAVVYGFSHPSTPGIQRSEILWLIFISITGVVMIVSNWLDERHKMKQLLEQGKQLEKRFKKFRRDL